MSTGTSYHIGFSTTRVVFTTREKILSDSAPALLAVLDEHTRPLFTSLPPDCLVLATGEAQKAWSNIDRILKRALDAGLGRDGTIIGVGGGVVCDTVAFAASVYMRGCRLVLVPTTLLAMVDAAFGGKTGINFDGLKNMVGTFYPAAEVRIAIDVLRTLPEREFRSGLAEVIKGAMLADADLFSILEQRRDQVMARDERLLEEMVRRSIAVKAHIVAADPTERGIRAHLNLGHTFAHAVESAVGLGSWTHGEAVAWGIARAMDAGVRTGLTDPDYRERIMSLLHAYGYKTAARDVAVEPEKLIELMTSDKKKRGGTVRFIMQRSLCDTVGEVLDPEVLRAVLS